MTSKNDMDKPLVSVVVPAYNAKRTIGLTLQALIQQTYKGPTEIFVVDDGSRDHTAEYILEFSDVIYIRQSNQGPAVARNRGFRASKGEFVFFTDSDCIPELSWIEKCLAGFTSPEIGVVCGSYGIANPEHILARCIHQEILYRHQYLMPDFPKAFGSYNFCVRRNLFEAVGGFNEGYRNPSGEDNDLSYKILRTGSKIYFSRDCYVEHFFPTRVGKYLREQFRHGFWRAPMYRDHWQMVAGDDYTFWKDIIEPPLCIAIVTALAIDIFLRWDVRLLTLGLLALLSAIEIFFGFAMTRKLRSAIFFAFIMFLRAFARTAGFLLGVSQLFSSKKP